MLKHRIPLALAVLLLSACQSHDDGKPAQLTEGDQVKVVGIVKGDELAVTKDGKKARVRLLGIQAFSAVLNDPQVQALSAGGISALGDLAKDKTVTVAFDHPLTDTTGRYLAIVTADGVEVNKKLIDEGWAVTYTEFPFTKEAEYLGAEAAARTAGRNIWGLKTAADLVRGLRKQWDQARIGHGGAPLADPLLSQAP